MTNSIIKSVHVIKLQIPKIQHLYSVKEEEISSSMYSSSSESSTFLLLFAKNFSKIFKHFMKIKSNYLQEKEFNGDEKCAF